ncbi:formin-like protein 14 [Athalia rosae]|uniref:formin-like protein 14 n=1 Tax=Athalia rosae TaxID=37344 RepID=UPI002033A59D|nr:formin-like protein 14 [Athalia rosae]
MRYLRQILLCCTVWTNVLPPSTAQESPGANPELLKTITRNVESVLSPTLVGELTGVQSNRTAVNLEKTAPRNPPEQTGSINDKKPEIQFDNQVYPYHYERSYHYQYPPDPSRPEGYSENFYRPKNHVPNNYDPTYYRSELYNPFDRNSQANSNAHTISNTDANVAPGDGDAKPTEASQNGSQGDHIAAGGYSGPNPVPSNSFAYPDVLPRSDPFPSVDFDGYRHGGFGRPLVHNENYFRPSGEKPIGHYLPQGEARFPESHYHRPVESYQYLPPLHDSFHSYPTKDFPHRSQHLPSPYLGSFFPGVYPGHFNGNHRPSDHFNNLFSDNFTRNFPPRPPFGGFYPNYHYLPPTPPGPTPDPGSPAPAEQNSENPVDPPKESSSQSIPTTKPDDSAPVPAASNSNYEVKVLFPIKGNNNYAYRPRNSQDFLEIEKNFRF